MPTKDLDPRIEALLIGVEQAFDHRAWHGPNLKNSLRGVTPDMAVWRPQPERHNIWELAVHAAYWKYRILRKLSADAPQSFDEAGSDFFERPMADTGATKAAWQSDCRRLDSWHEKLVAAIRNFDPERMGDVSYDRYTCRDLMLGAAAHDVYHAGQIRLLRRMWGSRIGSSNYDRSSTDGGPTGPPADEPRLPDRFGEQLAPTASSRNARFLAAEPPGASRSSGLPRPVAGLRRIGSMAAARASTYTIPRGGRQLAQLWLIMAGRCSDAWSTWRGRI